MAPRTPYAIMSPDATKLYTSPTRMKDPGKKDLLQEKVGKAPGSRGKYNNACDMCHRKKIKCDGVKPHCRPCQASGRQLECSWNKNPARKPRTEQHFEALHKRAENLRKVLNEYRRYADYLESVLDQQTSGNIDFRALRPSIPDGLMGNVSIEPQDAEFILDLEEDGGSESDDPTSQIRLFKGLTVDETGHILLHRDTAPFRFRAESSTQPSRFPAILEDPQAMYILIVDAETEAFYNPDFDWARHLPSAVPLDRRSHDKALDLFFKFFTSWCFRIVPGLFLRDMCRALHVPISQDPPKTPHYSPMLHNALVALALAFLDDPKFRDFKTRQYFAEKAKSFLEAECQKPNISVVQALSFIGSFHSSQGDQTLGYMYFGMSARVSQALGLNVDCTEWVKSGRMDESDRHDRNWTNWTTFSQDVCWSLYVGRDFSVPIPDLSMPLVDMAHDQMPNTYGHLNAEPQPNLLTMTFEATCQLLVISRRIMDVVNCLSKQKARPYVIDELISEIDVQLNNWKGSLPPELEITVKSRPTATPHKLMLHLAYWWLFILLHRPFFRRKGRPIASMDREIDHVKLCRRAAENIMENLATWRNLYSLRYCPVTLIQTVFSAGTVYLLTATQASSGIRIAWKEMDHATKKLDCVMDYLQEIGASWQCATNIAGILKGLMQDQPRLLLNGKGLDIHNSLQIPSQDDDDEPPTQGYHNRMPLRKESGPRSRSRANSKTNRRGSKSLSRGPPANQTISFGQGSENSKSPVTLPLSIPLSIPSSTQNQTHLHTEPVNILVQNPSGPPSVSGSPKSHFIDLSQYAHSPTSISRTSSLCDNNERRDSPSTTFDPSLLSGRFSYANSDQNLSHQWEPLRTFEEQHSPTSSYDTQGSLSASFTSVGPSGSSTQPYLSPEITGFTGMLGGQALSQFPSFGIPINANGPFLLNPPGPHSNHFYLAEGSTSTDHLQTGALDNDFELLME